MPLCGTWVLQFATVPKFPVVLNSDVSQMYDTNPDLKAGLHHCTEAECLPQDGPCECCSPPELHGAVIPVDCTESCSFELGNKEVKGM